MLYNFFHLSQASVSRSTERRPSNSPSLKRKMFSYNRNSNILPEKGHHAIHLITIEYESYLNEPFEKDLELERYWEMKKNIYKNLY